MLSCLNEGVAVSLNVTHSPAEVPTDRLRETYETNVFGVVAVTNARLPFLQAAGTAKVVNISSSLGSIASLADPDAQLWQYANLLAYNSSKTALNAITWTITCGLQTLTAHVVVQQDCFRNGEAPRVLDTLQTCLAGHFDVEHSTFQLEPEGHREHEAAAHH